jgi:hypothetical protein
VVGLPATLQHEAPDHKRVAQAQAPDRHLLEAELLDRLALAEEAPAQRFSGAVLADDGPLAGHEADGISIVCQVAVEIAAVPGRGRLVQQLLDLLLGGIGACAAVLPADSRVITSAQVGLGQVIVCLQGVVTGEMVRAIRQDCRPDSPLAEPDHRVHPGW